MIVVTGATGKLGRLIVEELALRVPPSEIGVSVRDPEKASDLSGQGIRVTKGDFSDAGTLTEAFEGASQVLLVSSNARAYGGDTLGQHKAAIKAAVAAGVERILYTSQIASSATSAFPPALDHAATEVMLAESGLAWTALRHGFYADSALMFMGREWQQGKISAPLDGKVSWTSHSDLAAAAAAILTGVQTFDGSTPPLTASEALDLADLGTIASELIDRPILRETLQDDAFGKRLSQAGLPQAVIDISLGYYEASRQGEFSEVHPLLEQLIGRRPGTMRDLLRSVIQTS